MLGGWQLFGRIQNKYASEILKIDDALNNFYNFKRTEDCSDLDSLKSHGAFRIPKEYFADRAVLACIGKVLLRMKNKEFLLKFFIQKLIFLTN